MNMPSSVSTEPETIITPTPADHEITPRDRRFGREAGYDPVKYWQNGDPVATAFYNCLSLTFPRGEAFFIESVKQFRDHTPQKLQKEIRAFIQQEVIHSREHLALNRRVEENGYDTSRIEQRITESLGMTKDRPKITNLAATMILEHFTAIMAQQFLANPRHWQDSDPETADLWRWHALEEIEHKGVAYDTWLYATRDWSRWQRWKVKALMMLIITRNFWGNRWNDSLDLLAQDGMTGKAQTLEIPARRAGYCAGDHHPVVQILPARISSVE
jgi:predicted metal-dependent hydrolase